MVKVCGGEPTSRICFAGVSYVLQSEQAPCWLGQQGRMLPMRGDMVACLWVLNRLLLLQPASQWHRPVRTCADSDWGSHGPGISERRSDSYCLAMHMIMPLTAPKAC